MKQKELSVWLRAVVVIGWVTCAVLSFWIVPVLARETAVGNPEYAYLYLPCLIGFWAGMVPVVIALWLAWRIFAEIGKDNSFCPENARRLTQICRLALLDTILCLAAMVVLLVLHALHPGVLLLLLFICAVGAGLSAAAASLSHLTQKAALLQEESELTV